MKGLPRRGIHLATAVVFWMVFTTATQEAHADKQAHVLLLITQDLRGDQQRDLIQSVEAHLSGLPVEIHTTSNTSLDVHDVSAVEKTAAFFNADSVVWTNSDLGDARFWNMAGDSQPLAFSVPDTGEGWLPRCEAFASIVLSMISPRLLASPQQRESTSAQGQESKPVEPSNADPFVTLQFRIGVNFPTSRLNPSVIAGMAAEIVLPPLDNRLSIALDASFTRPRLEGEGNDPGLGAYSYVNSVYELKIAADLIVRPLGLKYTFIPLLGVGPAVQFLKTTQTSTLTEGRNFEQNLEIGSQRYTDILHRSLHHARNPI